MMEMTTCSGGAGSQKGGEGDDVLEVEQWETSYNGGPGATLSNAHLILVI